MRRFLWFFLTILLIPQAALSMNPLDLECWRELVGGTGRALRNAELPRFHDVVSATSFIGHFKDRREAVYLTRAGLAIGAIPQSSKDCSDPAILSEMPTALKERAAFFSSLFLRMAQFTEFDKENKFFYMTTSDFWKLFSDEPFLNAKLPAGEKLMLASWPKSRPIVRIPYFAARAIFNRIARQKTLAATPSNSRNHEVALTTLSLEVDSLFDKLALIKSHFGIVSGTMWGPDDLQRQQGKIQAYALDILETMLLNSRRIYFDLSGSREALIATFERELRIDSFTSHWPSSDPNVVRLTEITPQTTIIRLSDFHVDNISLKSDIPQSPTAQELGWAIALVAADHSIHHAGISSSTLLAHASSQVDRAIEHGEDLELLLGMIDNFVDLQEGVARLHQRLLGAVTEFFVGRIALPRGGNITTAALREEIVKCLKMLSPGIVVPVEALQELELFSSASPDDRISASYRLERTVSDLLARSRLSSEDVYRARMKLTLAAGYWDATFRLLRYQLLGGPWLSNNTRRFAPAVDQQFGGNQLLRSLGEGAAGRLELGPPDFGVRATLEHYPYTRLTASPRQFVGAFQVDLFLPAREATTRGVPVMGDLTPTHDLEDLRQNVGRFNTLMEYLQTHTRPLARSSFITP